MGTSISALLLCCFVYCVRRRGDSKVAYVIVSGDDDLAGRPRLVSEFSIHPHHRSDFFTVSRNIAELSLLCSAWHRLLGLGL